jgi:hypothetical protein
LRANIPHNHMIAIRVPRWIEDDLGESRQCERSGMSPIWIDEPHIAEPVSGCAGKGNLVVASGPVRPRGGHWQRHVRQRASSTSRRRNDKQVPVLRSSRPNGCYSATWRLVPVVLRPRRYRRSETCAWSQRELPDFRSGRRDSLTSAWAIRPDADTSGRGLLP